MYHGASRMAKRQRSLIIIFILLVAAIAISGCEEWEWLSYDKADTNITTTTAIRTVVTDIDGNPIRNAPVYISVGKVASDEDVPGSAQLAKVMTDENGVATYSYTDKLDYGDGIWYGVSTDPAITDFRNGIFSTSNTVFYDDAKTASNGGKKASLREDLNLYKVTDRPLLEDIKEGVDENVFNVRSGIQSLTTSSEAQNDEEPVVTPMPTPTPAPGTGFKGEITNYGMSSATIRKGDNISAFMDIRNTGGTPIKDIQMVGQIFVYDTNKKEYVLWNNRLLQIVGVDPSNIEKKYENVNVQPGSSYTARVENKVPSEVEEFGFSVPVPDSMVVGKYKMIVRAIGVDANGKQVDLGTRGAMFEIAPGKSQ
jgi:hypothetical protein